MIKFNEYHSILELHTNKENSKFDASLLLFLSTNWSDIWW